MRGAPGGRWNGVRSSLEEEDVSMCDGDGDEAPASSVPTTPIILDTPTSCVEIPMSALSPPHHRMSREGNGDAPAQKIFAHK